MEEEEERGRGMKAPRGREVASAGSPRGGGGGRKLRGRAPPAGCCSEIKLETRGSDPQIGHVALLHPPRCPVPKKQARSLEARDQKKARRNPTTPPQGFQEAAWLFGGDHGLVPSEVMPCFASALPARMARWKCWRHALGPHTV